MDIEELMLKNNFTFNMYIFMCVYNFNDNN